MPRGTATFNAEAAKPEVSPIIFVRVLNIPDRSAPSTTYSHYFTDAPANVVFFDENDAAKTYLSCGLSYSDAEASTSNEIGSCTLRIDNVDTRFSELAKMVELNGATVHVLRGFTNTLSSPDGAQLVFRGHIQACVISEHALEATVTTDFSLKTKCPRRMYWPQAFPHLPSSKDPRTAYVKSTP
jgi:hypothetical protein